MKKLIFSATLILSLGLAACGDVEEISDENVNAGSESVKTEPVKEEVAEVEETSDASGEVSESEIGKMTTIYQNKEISYPIESGTAKASFNKIRYATLEVAPDYKEMFDGQDVVTLITVEATAENTSDETVNFYVDQATLVSDTGQQVDADMLFSDNIGGEFLGAVKKEGNIQWILKHDENIKKVSLHISGASDSDYNRMSEDIKVEIPFE